MFLPVTIAHEYAHQRGVAAEQEANFVGIMASIASGRPAYVYSGWLYGYQHLSNALYRADPEAASACMAELPAAARADFVYNNAYWASWEGPIREVGETVYDNFLRSYGGGISAPDLKTTTPAPCARQRAGVIIGYKRLLCLQKVPVGCIIEKKGGASHDTGKHQYQNRPGAQRAGPGPV